MEAIIGCDFATTADKSACCYVGVRNGKIVITEYTIKEAAMWEIKEQPFFDNQRDK